MSPWDKFKAFFLKKVLFKTCLAVTGAYYGSPVIGSMVLKFSSPERVLTLNQSIYPFPTDLANYFQPFIAETNYKINFYVYNQPNVSVFMHCLHDGSFTVFLPKKVVEQLEEFQNYTKEDTTNDFNESSPNDQLHKGSKIMQSFQVLSPSEVIYLVDYMCSTLNSNKFAYDSAVRIVALLATFKLFKKMSISHSWHSYRYAAFAVVFLVFRLISNFNDSWFVYNYLTNYLENHPEKIYFGYYYYTNMILRASFNRLSNRKSSILLYTIHRRFYRHLLANEFSQVDIKY